MNKILKTNKKLSIAILAAFSSVLLYYFIFVSVQETNGATTLALHSLDLETSRQAKLVAIERLVDENVDKRAKLKTYSLPKEDVVSFIGRLEQMARDVNINLEITSVNVASVSNDKFESLVLEIQADGTWSDVFYFISLVENLPLRLDVNNLNLEMKSSSSEDQKQNNRNWEGVFQISVLEFK